MAKTVERRIETLVRPIVETAGLFLERLTVTSGQEPLVRVTVDLEDGAGSVGADQLQSLTREISAALDEDDPIEQAYRLEVSTPGAERELSTPRHFARSVGRLVEIKTKDGKRLKGRILSANENSLELDVTAKKGQPAKEQRVELDNISKARSRVDLGSIGR